MDMHDVLESLKASDEPSVLATIVCVEGHSYRKVGASMLFNFCGEQIGSISPGCLEQDLLERAAGVWDSSQFICIDYNMKPEEDAIWGENVGCGGEIRLLLEPVEGRLRTILLEAKMKNDAGISVRLERSWNEKDINYVLIDNIGDQSAVKYGDELDSNSNQMSIVITPRPRLVLFGVGKDAEAIYSLAIQIGFRVVMTDWRPALCTMERFPQAEFAVGSPVQIMDQIQFCPDDYLIVCSHNLQQDKDMIRLALPMKLVYIGVLGSKKRIRMLFETFLIPSNVHAPIGLSINADGPYEIAVSIAAELIAIRAGREGGSRREGSKYANFSPLFSSRAEQAYGSSKAIARAVEEQAAGANGTACSFIQ
ncbi:XdhC family protein [Bacillus sp. FJAT-28004]|uniref:XdhC family protein n=1 Tax=Bacillus sp. FJAT-28004 TaxID=1679165 RepID=UPI0006B60376|nr:XdhC family protein [Bacillus sp. FJAT-28004]